METTLNNGNQYLSGVGFMLISSLFIALSVLIGKWLTLVIALPLVIFLRCLVPALILWWIALITTIPKFDWIYLKLHLTRALFVVLCQTSLFYYLRYGSLLNATLLIMTSPLFVPLLARFTYKTTIQSYQWLSLLMGFLGVIFVLQPNHGIFAWYALIGLASGFFNACSQLCFHKLNKHADANNVTLYSYTFSSLLALFPVIIFWHNVAEINLFNLVHFDTKYWLLFLGLAMASISNQTFRGKAFHIVNKATSMTPFMYTAIIFSGLLDWFVFRITPNCWVCIGACLIFISAMIMIIAKPKIKK